MIGNYDKKRKEQKKLLKELESIKSLLDDGELIDDDYSSLAETAIKKSVDDAPPAKEQNDDDELLIADDITDDFLVSNKLEIDLSAHDTQLGEGQDIPILQEMVLEEEEEEEKDQLAPGVLPGQQSLFEEHSKKETTNPNPPEAETKITAPKETVEPVHKPTVELKQTTQKTPKLKTTENPFLPKHIRERLNGTVDIPAYALPNETIRSPYIAPHEPSPKPLDTGFKSNPFASTTPKPALDNPNQQQIIDSLVDEFMPKIESKLRVRLAQMLSKQSPK